MSKFENVSDFWNQYSSDPVKFENEVRMGIWFYADGKNVLPEPPEGYYWVNDPGGIMIANTYVKYRLWADRLGYMPGSE